MRMGKQMAVDEKNIERREAAEYSSERQAHETGARTFQSISSQAAWQTVSDIKIVAGTRFSSGSGELEHCCWTVRSKRNL